MGEFSIARLLIVLAILTGSFSVGIYAGHKITNDAWLISEGKQAEEQNKANKVWEEKLSTAEDAAAEAQAEADSNYQDGLADGRKDVENTAAAIDDGSIRVRDHFTCPKPKVAKAAVGVGSDNGTGAGGLQPDDAKFLVRFAGRCNAVKEQLVACQGTVRNFQALLGVRDARE